MKITTLRHALAIALGAASILAGTAGFHLAQAQDQQTDMITIKDFMFSPMSVTIKAGSTLTWKNLDDEPHTVVSDAGLFRSAALDQNETFEYKFTKPGVYRIFCGIHPNMRETITVQ
ncbi:EfeO-type cupredoxin-like domain-containing protein [Pararobbsia alpina]|uniref:cupredoxin domain-containing protein n=1 Tax=Pararobbsia alpina TaxID=621374 RepID=UPI0039A62075